uniref:Uncharacterized protein n=1 Tax=Zea mays TaxID=4577 RepID=A0A804MIH0_MAIZE
MSSWVTKSLPFLVAPAVASPTAALQLTSMDRALVSLPVSAMFVYENPIDRPAETIRRALSRALVPYYPMAGRLAVTGDQLKLACTGEGVAFVGASASCTLQDARLCDRRPVVSVEDLSISYAGQYSEDPPLLLVQAVGEFARGSPSPSVLPMRVDDTLSELPPPITTMTKALVSSKPRDMPSSYITVPLSFVDRIKGEFRRRSYGSGSGQVSTCTAFDVFTAAIWKCRARATIGSAASPDAPTALAFTVNVRKPAKAKDGYYGNVFAFGLAASTLREVADGDILDLVTLVRDAKARVPFTFADGAAHIADEMGGRLKGLDGYDTLYVTSWWNLGLDDVDFGSGGAERVIGCMERKVVPGCFLCGKKDKAEGVAAMALCVKQEHAEAFHAELRSLK